MKRIFITSAIFVVAAAAVADVIVDNVAIDNFTTERNGNYLSVGMTVDLKDLGVESNSSVVLRPRLVNAPDSIDLPPVAVYGRKRYYYYLRNGGDTLAADPAAIRFRAKDMPDSVVYSTMIPYQDWMNGASLAMQRVDRGCCNHISFTDYGIIGNCFFPEIQEDFLTNAAVFFPELVYIRPKGELTKHRSLQGRANVEFRVDKYKIDPEYRNNTAELAKIIATIDTVRTDPDANIDTVFLKGFASPESPYAHNSFLATNRTDAVKNYIDKLYDFGNAVVITDFEPEDWAGLRAAVEKSNLQHRAEILAIIDSDMKPDPKEHRIMALYPDEYKFMKEVFYPALRHTDYRVAYTVRSFVDPAEILRIMKTRPQNLDQNEFYVAASTLEPGADEFSDVFETAVLMFPTDSIANLNAANAAMRRGDLYGADRYLKKAGNSAEAVYARGCAAIRRRDFDTARDYLKEAEKMGLEQARKTLDELNEKTKYLNKNK